MRLNSQKAKASPPHTEVPSLAQEFWVQNVQSPGKTLVAPPWRAGPDMTTPASPPHGPGSQDRKPSLPHPGPDPSTACPGAMWHSGHSFPPGPLVCLFYFTKNNNNKVSLCFTKIDSLPPPPPTISTGHSLDSVFQSPVLLGRISDHRLTQRFWQSC